MYFSEEQTFRKPDLKVRVGIKERDDTAPLCYCFEYTRAYIREQVGQGFTTEILDRIGAEIQAGFCSCVTKNPSGTCCLGDVARAVQQAKRSTDAANTEPE